MTNKDILSELASILGRGSVMADVPMKDVTSIRTGGNARYMAWPDSVEKIRLLMRFLVVNSLRYVIAGNCTNMIFPDEGYDGVVVRLGPKFSRIDVFGEQISAQAGAPLSAVASRALSECLTGFEFASGIPGTVGGAVTMNAGAYGGEMSQVVIRTTCLREDGELIVLEGEDHDFSYRHSRIMDGGLVALDVTLSLSRGNREEILSRMDDFNTRRREKQPLDLPSAGSVFKRPVGNFTGQLVQECGLRGFRIGGAQVSEKHCGFIVNLGNATSRDVLDLIELVKKTVFEKKGVLLEPEVRIIGG